MFNFSKKKKEEASNNQQENQGDIKQEAPAPTPDANLQSNTPTHFENETSENNDLQTNEKEEPIPSFDKESFNEQPNTPQDEDAEEIPDFSEEELKRSIDLSELTDTNTEEETHKEQQNMNQEIDPEQMDFSFAQNSTQEDHTTEKQEEIDEPINKKLDATQINEEKEENLEETDEIIDPEKPTPPTTQNEEDENDFTKEIDNTNKNTNSTKKEDTEEDTEEELPTFDTQKDSPTPMFDDEIIKENKPKQNDLPGFDVEDLKKPAFISKEQYKQIILLIFKSKEETKELMFDVKKFPEHEIKQNKQDKDIINLTKSFKEKLIEIDKIIYA